MEEATQTEIDQQEELKKAYQKIEELEKALKTATEASVRKEASNNTIDGKENQNNKRPAEKQDSPTDIKKSKTDNIVFKAKDTEIVKLKNKIRETNTEFSDIEKGE